MEPLEIGFTAPTIDFFKPEDDYGLNGVEISEKGLIIVSTHPGYLGSRPIKEKVLVPQGIIESIYVNDLGGLSIGYSDGVEYIGNINGSVLLMYLDKLGGFTYGFVARVKKKGEVIWENCLLQK